MHLPLLQAETSPGSCCKQPACEHSTQAVQGPGAAGSTQAVPMARRVPQHHVPSTVSPAPCPQYRAPHAMSPGEDGLGAARRGGAQQVQRLRCLQREKKKPLGVRFKGMRAPGRI